MVTVTLWSSCQGWQSELVEEKGIGFEAPRPFQGEERYSRRATHLVNETSTLCSLPRLSVHPPAAPRSTNQLLVMGQAL